MVKNINRTATNDEVKRLRFVYDKLMSLPFEIDFYGDLNEEDKKLNKFLREKYGNEIIDRFRHLQKVERGLEDKVESAEEYENDLYKFTYKTGLCYDVDPGIIHRTQSTYLILSKKLSEVNKDLTIVDLGSGEGSIVLGLAYGLDNVKKIYAVDEVEEAGELLRKNIMEMPEGSVEGLKNKIKLVKENFYGMDFARKIRKYEPNGVDVVVASNVHPTTKGLVKIFKNIQKKDGIILTVHEARYSEDEKQNCPLSNHFTEFLAEEVAETQNYHSSEQGVEFELYEYEEFVPYSLVVVSEGK